MIHTYAIAQIDEDGLYVVPAAALSSYEDQDGMWIDADDDDLTDAECAALKDSICDNFIIVATNGGTRLLELVIETTAAPRGQLANWSRLTLEDARKLKIDHDLKGLRLAITALEDTQETWVAYDDDGYYFATRGCPPALQIEEVA